MPENNKTSKYDVEPKEDPCGLMRELYNSDNLSIAHVVVLGKAREHLHKKMEEIYYVEKGKGQLIIGNDVLNVKEGDVIPIPKNTWHYLNKSNENGEKLEVLVISHPRYDPKDMIFKE